MRLCQPPSQLLGNSCRWLALPQANIRPAADGALLPACHAYALPCLGPPPACAPPGRCVAAPIDDDTFRFSCTDDSTAPSLLYILSRPLPLPAASPSLQPSPLCTLSMHALFHPAQARSITCSDAANPAAHLSTNPWLPAWPKVSLATHALLCNMQLRYPRKNRGPSGKTEWTGIVQLCRGWREAHMCCGLGIVHVLCASTWRLANCCSLPAEFQKARATEGRGE